MSAFQYGSNLMEFEEYLDGDSLGDVEPCKLCGDPAGIGLGGYCDPCGDELSDSMWEAQHPPGSCTVCGVLIPEGEHLCEECLA